MEKLNSEASLQDAKAALQETLARLKETEKMEEKQPSHHWRKRRLILLWNQAPSLAWALTITS